MKRHFVYPIVLALFLSGIAGCASLAEWYARAVNPRPDTGSIPAIDVGKAAAKLPGNLGDLDAWEDLAKGLIYIFGIGGVAGGATIAVKRKIQKKKNATAH
jgi:hypothetical protein